MPDRLRLLLADCRRPSGDPIHPGGVLAAASAGLVSDVPSLRTFLLGRLRTVGTVYAFTAAAVCARAGSQPAGSLWRAVDAELDARIAAPAARRESRALGGDLLRRAAWLVRSPILDGLGRASVAYSQRPHHAVAIGGVAAAAGDLPAEAAAAAAHASVSYPVLAARASLELDPAEVAGMYAGLEPEIARLAERAAAGADRPLVTLPATGAPALDYLIEAGAEARRGLRAAS